MFKYCFIRETPFEQNRNNRFILNENYGLDYLQLLDTRHYFVIGFEKE